MAMKGSKRKYEGKREVCTENPTAADGPLAGRRLEKHKQPKYADLGMPN